MAIQLKRNSNQCAARKAKQKKKRESDLAAAYGVMAAEANNRR